MGPQLRKQEEANMATTRKIAQGSLQQIFMFYIVKAIPKKAFDCFPLLLLIISYTWYKQWKVRSGCLEKFALGNSRGQIFQTTTKDFPLFFRLLD